MLPDYWGEPGQYDRRVAPAPELNLFATQGLPPMIQALQQLDAEGHPLKIGLFLDTTILNDEDLTTDRGKQIFYASIRDYYSRIPPRLWAAIGGQPVIWLYDAQRVGAFDQSTFDYVYEHFAQDFGGLRPFIVREDQWYTERAPTNRVIPTEGVYGWGAARLRLQPGPALHHRAGRPRVQQHAPRRRPESLQHRPPRRRFLRTTPSNRRSPPATASWPSKPGTSSAKAQGSWRPRSSADSTSTSCAATPTASTASPKFGKRATPWR